MRLLNRHRLGHVVVDAAVVALAWWLSFYFRFDRHLVWADHLLWWGMPWVVGVSVVIFVLAGLYTRWWRYTSIRDLEVLSRTVLIAAVAVGVVLYLVQPVPSVSVPRGVLAMWVALTLLGMIGLRALARTIFERRAPGGLVPTGREVIVVGAGDAGQLMVREMLKKGTVGYTPIAILDDDPRKQGMRLHGVRVVGTTADLDHRIEESPPDEVVIAMPTADGVVRQRIVDVCRRHGVPVKTLPGVNELLSGDLNLLTQLREVQVEDVLGRAQVEIDVVAAGGYLSGRTVLVTGAGGSIGSELCRQIARVAPAKLVLVDHAEPNLFAIERDLADRRCAGVVPVILDVKDHVRLARLLAEHRPDVVFHASAYKHVPLMEQNPLQAFANNTLATRRIARLARDAGVERFVLVSTDKAVDPQTVMGSSKALCECVVEAAAAADGCDTRFIAVRFGNVLGSSGSVIPTFMRQIAAGGPVTVTDAEMTRFFMTIPEAAQLVVQAGGVGESGDVFVLDMGEPIKIIDLANDMIRLSGKEPGKDIAVEIVGIRPGEKLHEKLFADDEVVERTHQAKLLRARRDPVDPRWLDEQLTQLDGLVTAGDGPAAVALVRAMLDAPRRTPVMARQGASPMQPVEAG